METIFHRLIKEFIQSSPKEGLSYASVAEKYQGMFPDESYLSKSVAQLSKVISSQLDQQGTDSTSKYFSNSSFADTSVERKLNIALQGSVMPSRGAPKGQNLEPMQLIGCSQESAPLEIINKIVDFCQKASASKITYLAAVVDKTYGSTVVLKLSTIKGTNLELRFYMSITSYEPILSKKADVLKELSTLDAFSLQYTDYFDKLIAHYNKQLEDLGKTKQTSSEGVKQIKTVIFNLSVCKGKFKTFNDFVNSCKSVTPGKWFKYCNSGESLSFLLSIIDVPAVYKHMAQTSFKSLNLPQPKDDGGRFRDKVLTTIISLLENVVKPQLHNILTSEIEKFKYLATGSQATFVTLDKEYKEESLSLVEKAGAVAPEMIKKHANPDFIDKESTVTTIMYTLASTDIIYYLCKHLIDSENSVYVIDNDRYFIAISNSFKELVLSYFKG